MNVGVIGVGVAGTSHVFDLVSSDDFQVTAVCGASRARADMVADTFDVPASYDDPERMLAEVAPDAVVIAAPPGATPRLLGLALSLQRPVLVEKPAALNADALAAVIDADPVVGAGCVVAYNRRYQAHVHAAREVFGAGAIGRIVSIRCEWEAPFTDRYTRGDTFRRHAGFGEGVILDTACHILDTLVFLGVGPTPMVRYSRFGSGPTGADTHGTAEIQAADGAPTTMHIADAPEDRWVIEMTGTAGKLRLTREGMEGQGAGSPCDVKARDVHRPVDDLLRIRDRGTPLGASLHDAQVVLGIIDSIRASTRPTRPWQRPRAKALGRLNGAC